MGVLNSQILSTAFERIGDDWIWYGKAWTRGVVVSSGERDLYLDSKLLAFRRAIAGRQATYPRRPYWPTLRRILTATFTGKDPAES